MKSVLVAIAALLALAAAAAAQGYRIQPGDTLQIEVLEDESLNRQVLVLPDGSISLPLAGTLRAAGRTVPALARTITDAIAPNFAAEPTVSVAVASIPEREDEGDTIDVYLLGEINEPGRREVPPGTTFLQALAEAGGFTNFAAEKRLQLRRRDPSTGREYVYPIDYRALSRGAAITGNPMLVDGDVILVPERRLFE